jgi:hypothetical protein
LPSTLQKYINFLEDNSNYSTVCGRVVGFNYKDGRVQLWGVKSRHRSHQVTQKSSLERLKFHISGYEVTTVYGVHRTSNFKSTIDDT